ncbi:zinc-dependent alcohol dehydrogenase [Phytoactinopolyspora limicola]|uniref:zinc-dependent alcohol dehydrogenase n=1 Tax=Phytoactinopolyspora limicola TaxID=2715536 RepID=UPI00140DC682|nr:alcohol dehydrogenase catalytic domain-containing protein [Phytoactinopolyspora limicola]
MRVCQITGPRQVEIVDRPDPEPRAGHVVIAVRSASLCGTDVHQYDARLPVEYPRIPGHDCSGIVSAVAPDVATVDVGDRVAVKPSFPCLDCRACTHAQFSDCANKRLIGLWSDGCLAESLLVPASNVAVLPASVGFDAAANLEPFTVAINTQRRLGLAMGEWVVILGQGPIGLGQTRIAVLAGARVVAVDPRPEARDLARAYGAEVTVDPDADDVTTAVHALTNGDGAAAVIETAGVAATVELMPSLVRKYGQLANVGIAAGIGSLDVATVVARGLTVHGIGGNGGKGQYEAAIALIEAARIDPAALVTHTFGLADAAQAFSLAHNKTEPVIKVVLHP